MPSPTTDLAEEYELIKYATTTIPPRARAKRVVCEVLIFQFISKRRQKRMKKHPLADPVSFLSSQEFQVYFEKHILRPILSKVFSYLYPYILAFTLLWVIMFLSILIIIVLLLRARVK